MMVDTIPIVLQLVRERTGFDFSQYRVATLQRRIQNHMVSTGTSVPAEYIALLQSSDEATHALLERLTIKVSSFYRNPVTFDELRRTALPDLIALRNGRPLRVWSAGCSRGEEAYTVAMLLEEAGVEGTVLATDIDQSALRDADSGIYDSRSIATLPSELAERYLEPALLTGRTGFAVRSNIRNRVLFQRHDLTQHPAPGQFDLICCRNVLIYLQRDLHHAVLRKLRDAVTAGGLLCLGEAEWPTSDIMATLTPFPRKTRLFRAIGAASFDRSIP